MGRYFNPPVGELEITPFYSNNEICWEELRFSVPIEKWSEFQNSQLFHDLEAYVADLQTQDTQNTHRTPEYTVESEASLPHSMQWDHRESFGIEFADGFEVNDRRDGERSCGHVSNAEQETDRGPKIGIIDNTDDKALPVRTNEVDEIENGQEKPGSRNHGCDDVHTCTPLTNDFVSSNRPVKKGGYHP